MDDRTLGAYTAYVLDPPYLRKPLLALHPAAMRASHTVGAVNTCLRSAWTGLNYAHLDFKAAGVSSPISSVVSDRMSQNHLNQIAHYSFYPLCLSVLAGCRLTSSTRNSRRSKGLPLPRGLWRSSLSCCASQRDECQMLGYGMMII